MSDQHGDGRSDQGDPEPQTIKGNLQLKGTVEIPIQNKPDANAHQKQPNPQRRHTAFEIITKSASVIFSAALAVITYLQWTVYSQQAKTMILDQRPWVDFKSLDIDTGFLVTKDSVQFGAKYSLINSGRLPALRTNPNFSIHPVANVKPGENDITDLTRDEQIAVCKNTNSPIGNAVFPNQSLVEPYKIAIPVKRNEFDELSAAGKPVYVIIITGCVGYQISRFRHLWSYRRVYRGWARKWRWPSRFAKRRNDQRKPTRQIPYAHTVC